MKNNTEVTIIGAGPYGLSIAGFLKKNQTPFRIFGSPMQFWREMPDMMFLKSFGWATHIYSPDNFIRFDTFSEANNWEPVEPCSIASFTAYGEHVQRVNVPEVEDVNVSLVQPNPNGFTVTLASGESFTSRRVIVAIGLKAFARLPEEVRDLPTSHVTHTSDHATMEHFAGKTVFVIGAGQSALQAAALLHEVGARVEVFVRGDHINFSTRMPPRRSLINRILKPKSTLGVGLKSWVLATFPFICWWAPDSWRVPFVKTYLGPSVAWWLTDRVTDKFPIHYGRKLEHANLDGDALKLTFRDSSTGETRVVQCDHLIAGTGFEVDIDRLDFLSAPLRSKLARIERSVRLDRNFQSSVPGLYFVGTASAMSFGPFFRFISAAAYTSKVVSAHIRNGLRQARQTPSAVDPVVMTEQTSGEAR